MSLLAGFEAISPDLLLGQTLESLPSLTLDVERQYALDPAHPIAFCWARCRDLERLERTLDDDGTVDAYERITRSEEWTLYRIRRSDSGVVNAYRRWVAAGGELLDCRGTDGRWVIEMRFPDRESFTRYHEFLQDEDVEVRLHRLAAGDGADHRRESDPLTESQREALVLAHESGFYDIPRETTLETIADALEISNQAVSERLRRGQSRLIEHHLF
ncbi:helix-turn-helix domain-containing protein [Natrarchaeobaculum sulfurireducens]|uniref:Transcriptional regulator, contains HTH domain n=1 Tax=Natrarchaeobaculum sulfurireducens TaxID=2044521 RepID=A0A346PBJ8_9EURY|nr:helix-turn-helix domain-containing protein [Natrarchaeobaculum sulfurireducens]AXR76893.1 Transcriptional regulator, contains HTH domain [Natrarchaeobaculum sulfurireducens]